MEFKDNLKMLRMEKSVSFADIASVVGKSEAAVRAWEYGRAKPEAETLVLLAQYFTCTTDFMLGLSEFQNEKQERIEILADIENNDPETLMFLRDFINKLTTLPQDHRREIAELIKMHMSRDFTLEDRKLFNLANKPLVTLSFAQKTDSK